MGGRRGVAAGRRGDAAPRRRRRVCPPPVDARAEHDQRCKFANPLTRHNFVQHVLQRKAREAGVEVRRATVWELRAPGAGNRSQKQADLLVTGWEGASRDTLLDVGVTHSTTASARTRPSIDTASNNSQSWVGHARAANGYAGRKQSGYVKVIREKRLALSYCSFVVETYGAFGKDAWSVINSLCHPSTHPLFEGDFNAWSNPDPKRDFMLSIAFAIQRGNVRMLQRCASRRACNRSLGAYSRRLPLVGA